MAEQSAHEPTMEEILASIRRIISEDDAPAADAEAAAPAPEPEPEDDTFEAASPEAEAEEDDAFAAAAADDDDVLELTETYQAPKSVTIGDIDAYEPEPEPEPAPVAAKPAPAPKAAGPRSEGLVSQQTEASAVSAFSGLAGSLLVPHSDRTLEDVTRDLLRPLLQAWLDQHLPGIVEEQVRQEVERIARQRR